MNEEPDIYTKEELERIQARIDFLDTRIDAKLKSLVPLVQEKLELKNTLKYQENLRNNTPQKELKE